MSAARLKLDHHGWNTIVGAINDHATRIDWLERRQAELADSRVLPKPPHHPHSLVNRLSREFTKNVRPLSPTEDQLVAEVGELVRDRTEWRPMATAPRDGRWVMLRYEDRVRSYVAAVAVLDRCWESPYETSNECLFDGWLPIPVETP